jgi:hypothetical protein
MAAAVRRSAMLMDVVHRIMTTMQISGELRHRRMQVQPILLGKLAA